MFSKLGSADCTFLQWKTVLDGHTVLMLFFFHGAFLPSTFITIFVCICILFNNWEKGSNSHPDYFCSKFSLK